MLDSDISGSVVAAMPPSPPMVFDPPSTMDAVSADATVKVVGRMTAIAAPIASRPHCPMRRGSLSHLLLRHPLGPHCSQQAPTDHDPAPAKFEEDTGSIRADGSTCERGRHLPSRLV